MQAIGISAISNPVDAESAPFLPSPKQFFGILLLYFFVQLMVRSIISETAGIDEANQLMVGQSWSWGYGPHAPLYTWLMILFLKVFGSTEVSLTLLRELLLFGSYSLTYFTTRLITRSHAAAVVAAVALQFHPTIVYESQRELTHSVVASFMVLATLFSFLRLESGGRSRWCAFGLSVGLSVLSKYNAALYCAGLLLAALTVPELRPLVLSPKMLGSLTLALLVILPNLWWVLHHRELAFGLVYKFGVHEEMPWLTAIRTGLTNWTLSTAAHIAPLTAVFAAFFWRPLFVERSIGMHAIPIKLLFRSLLFITGMALAAVLLFKVTEFKDRWLQPIFITLPILLVACFHSSLTRGRLKSILVLGITSSIIMAGLASGRLLFTEWRGRRDILNAPFRRFAAELSPAADKADFIVAGDYWLGGNLRLWFPTKPIYSTDLISPARALGSRCLAVWEVTKKPGPPPGLLEYSTNFTGQAQSTLPANLEEVWKYHRSKSMRIAFWNLERSAPPAPATNGE